MYSLLLKILVEIFHNLNYVLKSVHAEREFRACTHMYRFMY